MAQRLETAVGSAGIVCRQGGDEFLVIINLFQSGADITVLAEKISRDVSKTVYIHDLMIINTLMIHETILNVLSAADKIYFCRN